MQRRSFLAKSATAAGAAAAFTAFGPGFWQAAFADPSVPGPGNYGEQLPDVDPSGLLLPAGFTSRIVAIEGQPVGSTPYIWPGAPDGGATFPQPGGGWIHAVNSELSGNTGGVSAIRYDAHGNIVDAYRLLGGTTRNCAGGPTPWGTWLSCEEHDLGHVWECDPTVPYVEADRESQRRAALGTRAHEAVAVDPKNKILYVTEDGGANRFYRFIPSAYPDLSAGEVQAARRVFAPGEEFVRGTLEWVTVTDPTQSYGGADSSFFARGEGCWYDQGYIYFTTTTDSRVWALNCDTQEYEVVYDKELFNPTPLRDADNITVHPFSGDLYVAEDNDGANTIDIVVITAPDGAGARTTTKFATITGQPSSEVTGPCFSPDGTRLYFSSQWGGPSNGNKGVTYEVTGPFRVTRDVEVPQGASSLPGVMGVAALAAGAAGAAALVSRRAGRDGADEDDPIPA